MNDRYKLYTHCVSVVWTYQLLQKTVNMHLFVRWKRQDILDVIIPLMYQRAAVVCGDGDCQLQQETSCSCKALNKHSQHKIGFFCQVHAISFDCAGVFVKYSCGDRKSRLQKYLLSVWLSMFLKCSADLLLNGIGHETRKTVTQPQYLCQQSHLWEIFVLAPWDLCHHITTISNGITKVSLSPSPINPHVTTTPPVATGRQSWHTHSLIHSTSLSLFSAFVNLHANEDQGNSFIKRTKTPREKHILYIFKVHNTMNNNY